MVCKKTVSSLFFLFSLSSFLFFTIKSLVPKSIHKEQLDSILTLSSRAEPLQPKKAVQLRREGKRELYSPEEGVFKKKLELYYQTSNLTLDQGINNKSISEKLENAFLIREEQEALQDKEGVYTTIEAKKASLVFDAGELFGEEVLFKKKKSSHFPEPFSEKGTFFLGTAEKIRGTIISGTMGFNADGFKGRFLTEEE